ncbi:SGNH/GDSL hydrolase family protein [Reyranella massiliensis]|uniref:SGNH/GDSL hydrolase family protein n=1 Tax=Reyranella massiliensis TaxID=445220 RepID=UPI0005C29C69|nr:SGNH/GDSL hydrolase family protein [Reyranella massiliensis]
MAQTTKGPDLPLWKKVLFSLILVVGFPVAVILAIEGAGYAILHFKHGVPGKSYGLWTYDEELGAIHASNAYNSNSQTNNLGFRNKEDVIEPKPPGAYRVIAYGGSTTFCYNLETDRAWPLRLQENLRARTNPKSQVLNAGAIMWSIGQEVARAKRDLPRLKPDIVIIYSGINEQANEELLRAEGISLERALAEGKHGLFSKHLDQGRWLKRNSTIVRFLEYTGAADWFFSAGHTDTHGATAPPPVDPGINLVVAENFDRTLREFIELIRKNGAKPVYVIVGGLPEVGRNTQLLRYSRQGAEVARQMGVLVIDSNDVVAAYKGNKHDLFSDSGVHWSDLGAGLLADFIDEKALRSMAP